MVIEMRTYKTKPGRREGYLRTFVGKWVPAHEAVGIRILGPFLSVEDPDTFVVMRGFPDVDSREPMKARFYESEVWKQELEKTLMPMLDRFDEAVVDDPEGRIGFG